MRLKMQTTGSMNNTSRPLLMKTEFVNNGDNIAHYGEVISMISVRLSYQ